MKEPRGLPYQKAAVLRMEFSSFCQLVSERVAKPGGVAKHWLTRPVQSLPQHKPLLLQNGAGHIPNHVQVPKTVVQPRQRHSAEELDAMRSKGICFKCKEKYFRGHVCPL